MILTAEDIRLIFDKIGREVVVPSSDDFPYEIITSRSQGYHSDPVVGKLQAKLGMMLQMTADKEERDTVD